MKTINDISCSNHSNIARENHKELHQLFLLDLLHCISVLIVKNQLMILLNRLKQLILLSIVTHI